MKIFVPDYYGRFRCIASECRHNCCIGWEIDIDGDTLELYKTVEGDFGKRLCANISDGDCACFVLDGNERCPFLNRDNLCDIIINLGEDALCDICREHPRYVNLYSDREEKGIGLCCEAAAELIIGKCDKTYLTLLCDDGEEDEQTVSDMEFFEFRQRLLDILQDRGTGIGERLELLLESCGISLCVDDRDSYAGLLLQAEYMEKEWKEALSRLCGKEKAKFHGHDTAFEQIAVYFICRHLAEYKDSEDLLKRVAFCVFCTRAIAMLCEVTADGGTVTLRHIADTARMFSAEIEYSEQNTVFLTENVIKV